MNWKLIAAAAVALFLTGYAAGACGKATSAEIEAARNSTAAAVERAEQAEDARAVVEIQALADILVYETTKDSALTVMRSARIVRLQTENRIVAREPAPDTAAFRRGYQAGRDSTEVYEVRPLLAALASADSVGEATSRLLAAEREARLRAQEGLRVALLEVGLLRDERPNWVARNWWKVAIPTAAYAGWKARQAIAR